MLLGNSFLPTLSGMSFLLRDDFSADRTAGSAHTNAAAPGPGGGTGTDAESKMSVSSGSLIISGGKTVPAWSDPARRYSSITRAVGRVLMFSFTTPDPSKSMMIGFDSDSASTGVACLFMSANAIRWWESPGSINISIDTVTANTVYDCAIFLRTTGSQLYIKGGKFVEWTLLWTSASNNTSSLIPSIIDYDAALSVEYIYMPSVFKLFSPVASDGFASWGSTDGLGHAEGVAAVIGAGGNGVAWTSRIGTWSASAGSAVATALSGGVAIATINSALGDYVVSVKLARTAGNCGVVVRWLDANNYTYIFHNGTQVGMRKVVAGVDSQVTTPLAATYSAGAELVVAAFGNTWSIFYNNVAVAIGAANENQLQAGSGVGLYTTDTGNTFDDFVVRSRGYRDDYDWLNQFLPTRPMGLFSMGDSKTEGDAWVGNLVTLMGSNWAEVTPRFATGGFTAASMLVYMASNWASLTGYAHVVIINFGANEFPTMPTQATWIDTMQSIIRQIRAKWFGCKIYVAKPWRRYFAAEANTLAGWVDLLVAGYPSGVYVGPDERIWLENGDDGATYTDDGIHYNTIAQSVCAQQWRNRITP